jgi:hypothetical protein
MTQKAHPTIALLVLGGALTAGACASKQQQPAATPAGAQAEAPPAPPSRDFNGCAPGTPCTIYDVDLSKGPGAEIAATAGNFTPKGWSCAKRDDVLHLFLPDAAGIARGYLEVTVENWDPYNQPFAPGVPQPGDKTRNEFMEVTEACNPRAGMRWKLRAGGGYAPFVKLEVGQPDYPGPIHIKDFEDGKALPVAQFDPSKPQTFRLSWDERSFTWEVAGARKTISMGEGWVTNHGHPLAGVCNVGIGEMFSVKPSMGCIAGPVWKSVKVVSLSGPPLPAPRARPEKLIAIPQTPPGVDVRKLKPGQPVAPPGTTIPKAS